MKTQQFYLYPFLSFFFLLLFLSSCNLPGKQPTAQQVIDRYVEVCGGKTRVDSVHSTIITGVATANENEHYRYNNFLEIPEKAASVIKLWDDSEIKSVYNQGKAAELVGKEVKPVTDKALFRRMRLGARNFIELGYKELGYKISMVNTEKYNGKECYRIKIVSPEGDIDFKLYEKGTGLLVMIAESGGNRFMIGNYKQFERFLIPTDIDVIYKSGKKINLHITDVKFNQPINPKVFQF